MRSWCILKSARNSQGKKRMFVSQAARRSHSEHAFVVFVQSRILYLLSWHNTKLTGFQGRAHSRHRARPQPVRTKVDQFSPKAAGKGPLCYPLIQWKCSHLIFRSFVPRVQLEGEGQSSKVEMEQLLCSIVNWTEGEWKGMTIMNQTNQIKKTGLFGSVCLCCEKYLLGAWLQMTGLFALLWGQWPESWNGLHCNTTHTHTHIEPTQSINIHTGCAALAISRKVKWISPKDNHTHYSITAMLLTK